MIGDLIRQIAEGSANIESETINNTAMKKQKKVMKKAKSKKKK